MTTLPRTEAPPLLLTSRTLRAIGVPHAFSTRAGGVSTGAFASLNFGNPGDLAPESRDPASNIHANWQILAVGIGAPDREIVQVHQVHGDEVLEVRQGRPAHTTTDGHDTRADAIVTDDPGRLAAVRTADCVPLLLSTGDGRIVAAVHAGWRGVICGIAPAVVARMLNMARSAGADADASHLAAAIGPCISVEHFEVGPEVGAEFQRVFGAQTAHVRPSDNAGKCRVDLKAALREQLMRAGMPAGRIDVLPECTYAQQDLFFSHRRATHERRVTGRMASAIGPRR